MGRDGSVGITTRYWLDGSWINPGGGEIFRTRPNRSWGPNTHPPIQWVLGYCGGKAAWAWRDHPPHLTWKFKKEHCYTSTPILWVRIPPGAWIFVCCECCVLSGRGLCDGLITRSEESYRMWRVVVCDQETS